MSKGVKGDLNPSKRPEVRKLISSKMKGRRNPWNALAAKSQTRRTKISKAMSGRKLSDETKKKLSLLNKGKKASPETRLKMSDNCCMKRPDIAAKSSRSRTGIPRALSGRLKQSETMKKQYRSGRRVAWRGDFSHQGIRMRSSWEVELARWLDSKKISWEYESTRIATAIGVYIPDFLLTSSSIFLEVKGYFTEISKKKILLARKKATILLLDKEKLQLLKVIS